MLKRTIIAFLLGMVAGLGIPAGLQWYQVARDARIDAARQRDIDARVVEGQRRWAAALQYRTQGKGRLELFMLIPDPGVGISYMTALKERDEKRSTFGIQVVEVYRDSAAGRAGIKPGDWVTTIGETSFCNVLVTAEDRQKRNLEGEQDKLLATAEKLFAEAGDSYVLTVERAGVEQQFRLTRGPVAPAVGDYIRAHLDEWDTYLQGLSVEAVAVSEEMAEEITPEDTIDRRYERLTALQAKINAPWFQLDEFCVSTKMKVPIPQQ